MTRLIGIDPGLRACGWGVIDSDGVHLRHVANGLVTSDGGAATAERLVSIYDGLCAVIAEYKPEAAAVEETFVNANPASALKLGQARGVAMLAPARAGLSVIEYSANAIKKSVVGVGHAGKEQVQMMVQRLLPGVTLAGADAADALAVAICHAHHAATAASWARGRVMAGAVAAR
ncbi:MAG: crossover junction endodeoxyribonuclease RuvC [Proteobacteria bacterium]|nr:crossover junction endodeoxyribonuclease RuvC [Pseudomonadota bacterium]